MSNLHVSFIRARRSRQSSSKKTKLRAQAAARQRQRRMGLKENSVPPVTDAQESSSSPVPCTSSSVERDSSPCIESSQETFQTKKLSLRNVESFSELAVPLPGGPKTPKTPLTLTKTGEPDKESPTLDDTLKLAEYRPNARKRGFEIRKRNLNSTPRTNCASIANVVNKFLKDDDHKDLMLAYLLKEKRINDNLQDFFSKHSDMDKTIWIHQKVTRLTVCRARGKWDEVQILKADLTVNYTIREVARRTGRHHSHIIWLWTPPKSTGLGRKVTDEDTLRVVEFIIRSDNSTTLPFKRFAGNFYLKATIKGLHGKYVEEMNFIGCKILSLTRFRKCLPKEVKIMKKTPYKNCACIHCSNFSLLIDALIATKLVSIPSSVFKNLIESMCSPETTCCQRRMFYYEPCLARRKIVRDYTKRPKTILQRAQENANNAWRRRAGLEHVQTRKEPRNFVPDKDHTDEMYCISDFKRECIFRECKDCTTTRRMDKMLHLNPEMDLTKRVVWRKWQNYTVAVRSVSSVNTVAVRGVSSVTDMTDGQKDEDSGPKREKRFGLRWHEGTLEQLWQEYFNASDFYTRHWFHFKWQVNQFEKLKHKLRMGEVVMVMDFAQNVAHAPQNEVQGYIWHRQSSMLHPIVCYFRCKYCQTLVTTEIVFISDHKTKNASTVNFFERQAILQLQSEEEVNLKYVYQFCDNCPAQYKCYSACDTLSTWQDFGICRNFYGEQHGKGPADGCIGRIVKNLDAAVRACKEGLEVFSPIDFYRYCVAEMETKPFYRGDCVHFRRRFKYIPSHRIPELHSEAKPVPNMRQMHSIRSTGERYVIEVRENSCFCPYLVLRTSRFWVGRGCILQFTY